MKAKIILALFFVLVAGFVVGCSDEVDQLTIPLVNVFSVDATASPMVAYVGDWVVFHADKRDGVVPYQGDYWYFRDVNVAVGEDYHRQMDVEGFFTLVVASYDAVGTAVYDSVTVTVLPAEVEPLTADLTPSEQVLHVGEYARFSVDARGGLGPKQYVFYDADNNIIGSGSDHFTRYMDQQGVFVYHVVVTDSLGVTAGDSAMATVVAPNIIEVCVESDLKVGPADCDDDDEVHFGQTGTGNVTVAMRFDTTERRFVVLTFHYADGTERHFVIPDLGMTRPSCVLVDLGQVRVEPTTRVSMRWTGSPSKCDQWVRATQFCLSLEGPNKALDGVPIIRLEKGGSYTIISGW